MTIIWYSTTMDTHETQTSFQCTPHSFWDYSLAIYNSNEIKELLISLQNECGMNVNFILFCCWSSACGAGQFSRAELMGYLALIQKWHAEITEELRKMRTVFPKSDKRTWVNTLRTETLEKELYAEYVEQTLLSDALALHHTLEEPHCSEARVVDAKANLLHYTRLLNRQFPQHAFAALSQILAAAFEKLPAHLTGVL